MRVRLRQVALVARELEPVLEALRAELGLEDEPFRDPGVAEFGLHNAVMALGDTFLEVVSPLRPNTAASRYLERRRGDGGYMAIFQVDDLEAARRRIIQLGIRVVWQADLPDIAATHLHPKDVRGALVSIDWASPSGSWRWGGPAWTGQKPEHATGGLLGLSVQSEDPVGVARRWGEVLDREVNVRGDCATVPVDGGELRFVSLGDERGEGICAIRVATPGLSSRDAGLVNVGGASFELAAS